MITFTIPSFISYTIFVSVCSCLIFILVYYIIDDIRSNKKIPKEKKIKTSLKIGGIYGRRRFVGDKNNPFSPIHEYSFYVAILDIKPSKDEHCDYCQYVFLNDNMSPYRSYSDDIIYSDIVKKFDDWEYIKDIDLNTIKI
jgi:hypothetical protein